MDDPLELADQKPSQATIGIVLALVIQFGSIIWFAATLNGRVDHVEAEEQSLKERYDREVVPRADLTLRLDRIEKSLDQLLVTLMQNQRRSNRQ